MNKQGVGKIEWTDYTWSPMTGCLGPADGPCPYCYARKIATRFAGNKAFPNGFAPTFHPERLDEPLKVKRPRRIFVASMADPFAPWVSHEHLDAVLDVIGSCPQHTFYMLTKWPQNVMRALYEVTEEWPVRELGGGDYIPNLRIGASVDTQVRAGASWQPMTDIAAAGWHTFVSIEPMLTAIDSYSLDWADWIILGAQSGRDAAKHQPQRTWVGDILHVWGDATPIFLKDSITALWPDLRRREWPQ